MPVVRHQVFMSRLYYIFLFRQAKSGMGACGHDERAQSEESKLYF